MVQCKGHFHDRSRCTRDVIEGTEYCLFHLPKLEGNYEDFNKFLNIEISRQTEKHPEYLDFTEFQFPSPLIINYFLPKTYFTDAVFLDEVQIGVLEDSLEFPHSIDFTASDFKKSIRIYNCTFLDKIELSRAIINEVFSLFESEFKEELKLFLSEINEIIFINCEFTQIGISLKNNTSISLFNNKINDTFGFLSSNVGTVSWLGNEFMDAVFFDDLSVNNEFDLNNNNFYSPVIIQNSEFKPKINFSNVDFKKTVVFKNNIFESEVTFSEHKFIDRVNFEKVVFNGDVSFEKTFFTYVTFTDIEFNDNSLFNEMEIKEAGSFSECRFLKYCEFKNAKINISLFHNSYLLNVDFRNTNFDYIEFKLCQIISCNFSNASFNFVSFLNSILDNVIFIDVNWSPQYYLLYEFRADREDDLAEKIKLLEKAELEYSLLSDYLIGSGYKEEGDMFFNRKMETRLKKYQTVIIRKIKQWLGIN